VRRWLKWLLAGPDSANALLEDLVREQKQQTGAYFKLEQRVHQLETVDKLQDRREKARPQRPRTWTETKAILEQGPEDRDAERTV
jgi:hypothetical protein